jgi:K+-sensing histidine kinase KdpD
LKSPLQGVLGNTELLIALARPGTGSAEDLRAIQQNAASAAGIVRNLLAFTEPSGLSCRWQNVNDIVRRACESCRSELQATGVGVQIEPTDSISTGAAGHRRRRRSAGSELGRGVTPAWTR